MRLFILICLMLAPPAVAVAQSHAEDRAVQAKARQILTTLQTNSFRDGREFCGLIGIAPNGDILAGPIVRGRLDSCTPRDFARDDVEPVASLHTHAAYDEDADAEVPSYDDLRADMDEGLLGFVATPGGRFWITIPEQARVVQICGLNCLPQDRNFNAGDWGQISKSYTLRQLNQRRLQY